MKAMNINPAVAVEYSKEAFAAKCKKAISKFIDTYLVFFVQESHIEVHRHLPGVLPDAHRHGSEP